ncbi:hypothetical protein OH77DRAFT_980460 [Trametes cingulata]|nr:hypothetical protein OH77DRAFT_980460 [Trametes cingulata]
MAPPLPEVGDGPKRACAFADRGAHEPALLRGSSLRFRLALAHDAGAPSRPRSQAHGWPLYKSACENRSGIQSPAFLSLPPTPPLLLRMAQYTFRVNPRPTYSERMTEARSELRKLIKEQLCAITHDNTATMSWSRKAYMKNVVMRYRVRIEGWPLAEVPFRNLSDVPNLGKLELLLHGWRDGTIRFVRITDDQYRAMVADPTPWIGPATVGDDAEGDE